MSENSFLREKATLNIIKNVASFCSECYLPLKENETIFYDMDDYRYLCLICQNNIQKRVEDQYDPIGDSDTNSGLLI